MMIREERRRRRERIFRIRAFLLALAAGILIGLLGLVVFDIKEVEVEGNSLYDSELITDALLNDRYSWNSLYVCLKYRLFDTEDIPFVDTMEVTMKGPRRLHVTVYEKGIMGYFSVSGIGENAYFDKDGFVVEISPEIIEGVPKVEGIDCSEVVLYEKLPVESSVLRSLLTLTQTLKRSDLLPETVTYGTSNAPILTYGSVSVMIGSSSNLTQKVVRLQEILPSLSGMSGTLHMENWTEESSSVIFDKT